MTSFFSSHSDAVPDILRVIRESTREEGEIQERGARRGVIGRRL
jgi:hypothetical protein